MFKSVFKSGIRAAYDVSNNPSLATEPWIVYPAKHYTTGKTASVFIFDKAKFEASIHKICSQMSNTKNPKVIISECYELIRNEVSQMAKLKHPQLLTLYEPLEETKSKFLFVSEPMVDTLLTVNMDKLDELSMQKGLLEICKGLQFLHNYCSIIHLNIQPSSIYINKQGDWKLAGFKFLANLNEISSSDRDNFFILNNISIVPFDNVNLNFTPPELVIDQPRLDFGNDIWSLACLVFYIYNKGEYLFNCFDSSSITDYKAEFRKFEAKFYNHRINDLQYVLKNVPQPLYQTMTSMLARYANDRINIDKIIDSDFFNGSLIKAMFFVDEFATKTMDDKLIFLKGLLEVREDNKIFLDQFPSHFKTVKLLPLLIELCKSELGVGASKDEQEQANRVDLITYVLTIIFKVGSGLSNLSFNDRIFNVLFKVDTSLRRKQRVDYFEKLINFSVKVRLAFIENLEIIATKANDHDVSELIKKSSSVILTLPSNEQHLKQEQIKLQDDFLNKVDLFIDKFDFPYIKNTFFPSIAQVFKTTTILSTKLATIKAFETMTTKGIVDRVIVKEQLLPIFENLKSRDKRIVATVLNFYSKLANDEKLQLDLETVVEFILPICLKLVFGCNECTQQEFRGYMKVINEIQTRLVQEKVKSLPTKVAEKPVPSSNFDSLINTQTINTGNLENLHVGPTSEVMRPTRTSGSPISPIQPRPKPNQNSVRSNQSPSTIQPSPNTNILQPKKQIKPLTLKPNTQQKLSFGATEPKNLFNLEGTFDKNEFSDFQSATPQPSPVPVLQPQHPQYQNQSSMTPMIPMIPKKPAGFSNTVLTPSKTQKKDDLLDFL